MRIGSSRRTTPGRRRSHRHGVGLVAVTALLLGLTVGCGSSGSSDGGGGKGSGAKPTAPPAAGGDALAPQPLAEKTKITIGWPGPYEVWASAIVADGMGEFEKENLEVEFTKVDSSGAIALLEQGKIDVFVSSVTANVFNAIDADASLRWVAPAFLPNPDSKEGIWVSKKFLASDGSVDVKKFKGSALGMGSGGLGASNAAIVVPWLEKMGLEATDFDYQTFTGPDILVGIENGSVSAGWLSDPYWVDANEKGLASFQAGFNADQSLSGYLVSGQLLGDKSDVGRAFVRALARTNRDHLGEGYHDDTEVVGVLAKAIGVEPDMIAKATGYRFTADLDFDHSVVEQLQKIWLQVGDILDYDDALPVDAVIDTSLQPGS